MCGDPNLRIEGKWGNVISPKHPESYDDDHCRRFINLGKDEAVSIASISMDICNRGDELDYLRFAMFPTEEDALSEDESCPRCQKLSESALTMMSSSDITCGQEEVCYSGNDNFNFTAYGPGTLLIEFRGMTPSGCYKAYYGFSLSFQGLALHGLH